MNREILFRAKDNKGNWIEGLPFYAYGTSSYLITHSNGWTPSFNNPDEGESTTYTPIKTETLGEFTGLYDFTTWEELEEHERIDCVFRGDLDEQGKWKGRKIFEGDIIKSDLPLISPVSFNDGQFNPELLEFQQ